MAAPRGRAPAEHQPARRALLRAVPLGDGRAAHAPPRQQALPAPDVHRHRAARAGSARASSTRSSAAPRRACSRSTSAWYDEQVRAGRDVPRRPPRRALARARGAHAGRRARTCASSSRRCTAISSARSTRCARSSASSRVDDVDRDVLGLHREGDLVELALLYVRARQARRRRDVLDQERRGPRRGGRRRVPRAALRARCRRRPARRSAGRRADDADVMCRSRRDHRSRAARRPRAASPSGSASAPRTRSRSSFPQRGPRVDLLALANENASTRSARSAALATTCRSASRSCKERLRLPDAPAADRVLRHLASRRQDTVGAIVAMIDGEPDKKRYRTFHVRGDASARRRPTARRRRAAGRGAREDVDGSRSRSRATTTARCTRCSRDASGEA